MFKNMIKLSELEILKTALLELEGHYNMYLEERDKSYNSRLKKDREHASHNMYVHAQYLEKTLTENPYVLAAVYDGNQFQFEDFINFVDSDMPGYIQKVKDRIEKLEEMHKEE